MPAILEELLARLRVDYPVALGAIAPGVEAPPTRDSYRLAPTQLGDGFANTVLVGNDLDFEAGGIRQFFTGSTLQIFIVGSQSASDFNILDYWSRVVALCTVLKTYLTCCINAQGINMWKQLVPDSVSGLPEEYASGYHGVMITYRMEFNAQSSGWPATLSGAN